MLLDIEDLTVTFPGASRDAPVFRSRLSLRIDSGEMLGIVGESGCGKSTGMLALMGLLDRAGTVEAERIRFDGHDFLKPGGRRGVVGSRMTMIFQEPTTSLNPYMKVGDHLSETLAFHGRADEDRGQLREGALELLEEVGIPDPTAALHAFPHEFSGGMNQRVMIALAIACRPEVLIADEPTTALDVTTQIQILDLLAGLQERLGMSVILISHDIALIANYASRCIVMKEGEIVEERRVEDLRRRPEDPTKPLAPYTRSLLDALPERSGDGGSRPKTDERAEVVRAEELARHYPVRQDWWWKPRKTLKALDGVSFVLRAGCTLGVVGESGCGKSTFGRLVAGVEDPTSGTVVILPGVDGGANATQSTVARMVFQNPYGSLNPRVRVGKILEEPLRSRKEASERRERAHEWLERVLLPEAFYDRYPHQLSGGERQRVAIARALIVNPRVVIADEPTAALDVVVQREVLTLFRELQDELKFACMFISHALPVVEFISDDVMIMYMGRVVEYGPTARIFEEPRHHYTKALLDSTLYVDPARRRPKPVKGETPSRLNPPGGCAYHPRCPALQEGCKGSRPALERGANGVGFACYHPLESPRENG